MLQPVYNWPCTKETTACLLEWSLPSITDLSCELHFLPPWIHHSLHTGQMVPLLMPYPILHTTLYHRNTGRANYFILPYKAERSGTHLITFPGKQTVHVCLKTCLISQKHNCPSISLCTGAPQGCIISPLLYSMHLWPCSLFHLHHKICGWHCCSGPDLWQHRKGLPGGDSEPGEQVPGEQPPPIHKQD